MRPLQVMAAGLLVGPLLLGGCGKKTPAVPPESAVPAPVADLRGELDPEGVTLQWSWPRKTEKGISLRRIDEFIVERAEDQADAFCADCPLRYRTIASLPGGVLPEQPEAAGLSYRDQNLQPGYHYAYRVRSSLGWRVVSAPAPAVGLFWQVPLTPPTELSVGEGEREVVLSWRPPERDRDGQAVSAPLLYQVQRSEAGQSFRLVGGDLRTPFFRDQGVRSGVNYQYRVRAARLSGGTGEYSAPLAITLRDLTPPPVPFGLAAVITGESVRLFWEVPSIEDLGGTIIYRRRQLPSGIGDYEQIGQVTGRTGSYIDPLPLLEPSEIRHYALKAFDRAEPANLSEYSREVQTTAKASRP
ncbi:MAG: fibronectin type III domain-containing protein [Desulfobulbaceae bacterium]|nr:fibronectin type III domain-containing protein [Desulfobulbaceae bacterium]